MKKRVPGHSLGALKKLQKEKDFPETRKRISVGINKSREKQNG